MPTNCERLDVAERLREIDPSEWSCYGHEFDERMTAELMTACGCNFGQDWQDMELCDRLAELIEPELINGETSDGYHTFNELYHHRAVLFSVVVRNYPELCWKSKKHNTGDMYEGMFIVGINTPDGQASYHYDIEPYWDMFECDELEFAPEWDGHTPAQAIERIGKLTRHEPERTCNAEQIPYTPGCYDGNWCSVCNCNANRVRTCPTCVHSRMRASRISRCDPKVCPECGAEYIPYNSRQKRCHECIHRKEIR